MKFLKYLGWAVTVLILVVVFWLLFQRPNHNRLWEEGQEKMPRIEIEKEKMKVFNYRDFDWSDDGKAEVKYFDKEFDLNNLEGTDVIISHFSDFEGLAHIFLSFRFKEGENLVVSVETRREADEEFSPWLGLLRRFEIIYVAGSERDIIGVRTDIRRERVYVYPTVADKKKSQELLVLIAKDINYIYANPTFYNTLFNNCINSITRRVEDISEIKFPLSYKTFLPGFMDEVLYDIKLIPNDKSFQKTKQFYLVNNDEINRGDSEYSIKIRK
ncbi:MAG: DUF4105 domain-containing protein [Candidatus Moranbacteria bacterium]|nr:DUF4105 domain-containing protein [Candidatus Moranbacteria bacterium]